MTIHYGKPCRVIVTETDIHLNGKWNKHRELIRSRASGVALISSDVLLHLPNKIILKNPLFKQTVTLITTVHLQLLCLKNYTQLQQN